MPSSGDLLILLAREEVAVVGKLLVKWRLARIEHDPNSLAAASAGDTQDVITVVFGKFQIRNCRISVSGLKGLENRALVFVAGTLAAIPCAADANVNNGDDDGE